jgi:hypothetical protein
MTEDGLKSYKPRVCASTWTMFWLVQKRAWTQHARSKFSFVIDNLLVFVASLFLGLVYFGDVIYKPPQPVEVRTFVFAAGSQTAPCLYVPYGTGIPRLQ